MSSLPRGALVALSLVKAHGHPFPSYLLLSIRQDFLPVPCLLLLNLCLPCSSITALGWFSGWVLQCPFILLGKSRLSSQAKETTKNLAESMMLPNPLCSHALGPSRMGVILALFPTPSWIQVPLPPHPRSPIHRASKLQCRLNAS